MADPKKNKHYIDNKRFYTEILKHKSEVEKAMADGLRKGGIAL